MPASVSDVASHFKDVCYNNRNSLMAGIIIAGYDSAEKTGKIFTIPLGGALHEENQYTLGGSGSSYIMGQLNFLTSEYYNKNKKMMSESSKGECIEMVKNGKFINYYYRINIFY